jgi:hypothetical protein
MEIRFVDEIFQIIKDKEFAFVYTGHAINDSFHKSTEKLRECLVKLEKREYHDGKLPQISENSPLKVSPKYQLDYLRMEIPQICNQYCISLASAYYFLPNTSDTRYGYFYKKTDLFFWTNVDSGFRFASSGWDRLSLLLKIAFNLRLVKYSLSSVLQAMPNQIRDVIHDDNFKNLKNFRDKRFSELEFKLAGGARHETTHVISRSTRFFFEFAEQFKLRSDKANIRRQDELKLLKDHHELFMEGINDTLNLINTHFDEKFYDPIYKVG